MRFTLIKDIKKDRAMRPILSGLLSFILLYLVADIFIKYHSFGIFPEQIKLSLFGNMEEFIDPISKAAFLELIHMEIFFLMMILLTLSTVFIRLRNKKRSTLFILNILMLSALLALMTLVLSFFIFPAFINLYVGSHLLWHIVAFYMSILSLWSLYYD